MNTCISIALTALTAAALAGCGAPPRTTTSMGGPSVMTPPATTTVVTQAATPAAPAAPAPARLSTADQQFVAVAAGAGLYEVEIARVAASRASNAQVRSYAQMLVEHHTANNTELTTLVRSKGHTIGSALPPTLQQRVTTLSAMSGARFDREFIRMVGVQDHRSAIAAFEKGRSSVTDTDLRAYIDKSLPTLRQHLEAAQSLAGQLAG
jgi:putative membrane protein